MRRVDWLKTRAEAANMMRPGRQAGEEAGQQVHAGRRVERGHADLSFVNAGRAVRFGAQDPAAPAGRGYKKPRNMSGLWRCWRKRGRWPGRCRVTHQRADPDRLRGLGDAAISPTSAAWSLRLSVRTSGFQPGKRGSTPLGTASGGLGHRSIKRFSPAWPHQGQQAGPFACEPAWGQGADIRATRLIS